MRKIVFAAVLGLFSMVAFARHGGPFGHMGPAFDGNNPFALELNKEITAILEKNGDTRLGDVIVGDMERMAGEISIAVQKEWYIRRAKTASNALPGAGQFMTGDPLGGSLFLLGDAAVVSGTLIGNGRAKQR